MKKKLVLIFFVFFSASFVILNGRFIISNLVFLFSQESRTPARDFVAESENNGQIGKTSVDADLYKYLDATAILFIPSLGITAPILFDVATDEPAIYKALERGVVNYPLTVKPGEMGTSVILGHSSALPWYPGKYGSIFALLGKLKVGNTFSVQYKDGSTFNFSVKKTLIYSIFSGKENLNSLVDGQKPSLILLSCWPIDVDYRRIAVAAELIE